MRMMLCDGPEGAVSHRRCIRLVQC